FLILVDPMKPRKSSLKYELQQPCELWVLNVGSNSDILFNKLIFHTKLDRSNQYFYALKKNGLCPSTIYCSFGIRLLASKKICDLRLYRIKTSSANNTICAIKSITSCISTYT
ncbi:hypothetical protein L9F63_025635, partial [Diploptera punctata]